MSTLLFILQNKLIDPFIAHLPSVYTKHIGMDLLRAPILAIPAAQSIPSLPAGYTAMHYLYS